MRGRFFECFGEGEYVDIVLVQIWYTVDSSIQFFQDMVSLGFFDIQFGFCVDKFFISYLGLNM